MGCTVVLREALRDKSGHLSVIGLGLGPSLCVCLMQVLVNDFPGSAAFLCPYKPRRLQPMLSLMIYPWN